MTSNIEIAGTKIDVTSDDSNKNLQRFESCSVREILLESNNLCDDRKFLQELSDFREEVSLMINCPPDGTSQAKGVIVGDVKVDVKNSTISVTVTGLKFMLCNDDDDV